MNRSATAVWKGDLKTGTGTMSTQSGALKEAAYGFATRFEDKPGSNPEELIAAAHAGCYSMALSGGLGRNDTPPTRISTTADVHLSKTDAGFRIQRIDLHTEAEVPGIDDAKFQEIAEATKSSCPVSVLLSGAEINLDAKLVG